MSGDRGSKQDRGKVRRAAETRSRARRKAKSTPEDLGPERRLQLARQIGKAGPRKAAFDLTGGWRSAQRVSAAAWRADNPPARCRHRCEPSPSARDLTGAAREDFRRGIGGIVAAGAQAPLHRRCRSCEPKTDKRDASCRGDRAATRWKGRPSSPRSSASSHPAGRKTAPMPPLPPTGLFARRGKRPASAACA